MRQLRRVGGFTLIEVLIASAIIVLLASVGLVSYSAAGRSGRDAKRKADLEQIRSALEIYKSENGVYPTAAATCVAFSGSTYIDPYPTDPNPSVRRYCYNRLTTTTYEVCAALENTTGSISCGSGCTATCNYELTNPW